MTPPFAPDRFPHLYDTAPLGIAIHDTDGRVIDANPALLAMAGRTLAAYPVPRASNRRACSRA